jgi:hypothetical protein
LVGTDGGILIAGFNVIGTNPRRLLIRAVGPTLTQFGVAGALADTVLELYTASARFASNDNWAGDPAILAAANQVGAFPLPAGSFDSALLVALPPGAYTVNISGVGGRSGVALVEVYEIQ